MQKLPYTAIFTEGVSRRPHWSGDPNGSEEVVVLRAGKRVFQTKETSGKSSEMGTLGHVDTQEVVQRTGWRPQRDD